MSALREASSIDRPVEDPWGSGDGKGFRWAMVVSLLAHGALLWGFQEGQIAATDGSDTDEALEDTGFEVSLVYVDVPEVAVEQEPDAETEFYSERSTRAADDAAGVDDSQPRIEGEQDEVFRLEDVAVPTEPRNAEPASRTAEPLQNSESEAVQESDSPDTAQEPPKASPLTDEDRALLETLFGAPSTQRTPPLSNDDVPVTQTPQQTPTTSSPPSSSRPRTLAEARRRQALAGEAIRQEGGAQDKAATTLVDTKGRTFGSYDRTVQLAVQARWYAMIEDRVSYVRSRGRVQIGFRIHEDGSLSRARVVETTVDPIMTSLCRAAITEPAPYGVWPEAMRKEIGEPHRDIVFTFHYR